MKQPGRPLATEETQSLPACLPACASDSLPLLVASEQQQRADEQGLQGKAQIAWSTKFEKRFVKMRPPIPAAAVGADLGRATQHSLA